MSTPASRERRQAERRGGDRRQPPRPAPDDSWFGALGNVGETGHRGDERTRELPASELPDTEFGEAASDSRFLSREARRIVSAEGTALRRILRTYVAARAALGVALVLAPWVVSMLGAPLPLPLLLVCLAYASQALSLWLLSGADAPPGQLPQRLRRRQWAATVGVDLLAFSLLHLLAPAAQLNYAALLALPVLMAGVLTQRLPALATAAGVALVLLAGVLMRSGAEAGDALLLPLLQAGLAGMGAFVITLLSGELAQRLAREERAARGSLELARQQAQLNCVVLEEMADGVLVIDRRCRVRAANPAARTLLGPASQRLATPFALQAEPAWRSLLGAVEQAYAQGAWPAEVRELTLPQGDGEVRTVQVRARFTRRSGIGDAATPPEDFCVLFLEDMRSVQARVRQEKLAAMGRVSAGIAHEIRNPLAAISQANALMLEDALVEPQRQLARIVEDNAVRLKRIVDDVMAVAPGAPTQAHPIDATAEVARICQEWAPATDVMPAAPQRLQLALPNGPLPVLFDADHLRRVLVNLLDNAARHAGAQSGALQLQLTTDERRALVLLSVASDGPPMAHDVERHLFEPFFSTRSRGTGLGLYICRELCERHGASIDFRLGPPGVPHRNVFRIVMRRAPTS